MTTSFKLPMDYLSYMWIHIRGSRGGWGRGKLQKVFSNTGPDPLKNHKATKPALNVGSSSARQRNAI